MSSTQTTTTAPVHTHHYVLTLDMPGRCTGTWAGALTPGSGETRQSVYQWLRQQITTAHPQYADANVLFFSLEPNRL
ncbi:hypothetical protein [Streptomyces lavendulocolor]|uniref:hypothetical protein n=1 Tax=Streptomyces lavendulocolor TaxID=67316 RepID=UPI00340A61FD